MYLFFAFHPHQHTDKDKAQSKQQADGRDSVRSIQEPASTTDELGQQQHDKQQKSIHHPLPFHTSPHHGYPGFGSPTYIIDPANGLALDPRYAGKFCVVWWGEMKVEFDWVCKLDFLFWIFEYFHCKFNIFLTDKYDKLAIH